jgi:hypothetical protein
MTSVIVTAAVAVMLLAPLPAVGAWSIRRTGRRLWLLIGVAVLEIAWWGDLALIAVGYREMGGLIDCWPGCTAWQEAAGMVLTWAPPATALLMAVAIVALVRISPGGR